MKNKHLLIIAIITLLIISFSIGVLFVVTTKKRNSANSNTTNNTTYEKMNEKEKQRALEKEIKPVLEQALKLNELYTSKALDKDNVYKSYYGFDCYMYNTDDAKNKIEIVKNTYYKPDDLALNFRVNKVKNEEILFVCPPPCEQIPIKKLDFEIISQENNEIIINLDGSSFIFVRDDGKLKLTTPLHICNLLKS